MAPRDAETLSRYASFLWVARGDLMAAEETFLDAIAAAPGNTAHTANYAHFLWSTGGEGTCYPLAYDLAIRPKANFGKGKVIADNAMNGAPSVDLFLGCGDEQNALIQSSLLFSSPKF
ncbi:hypothetical protein ZIOFF_000586 [Zingiber officinale]|uniref:Uncharacterized protein n=1 Tax=Zingiber officinale TaxID=94328 RepID=A0A8J5IHX9_ZINOF|nr:hypothetical protein ZIOFF_000586 [Zingiber officinale]